MENSLREDVRMLKGLKAAAILSRSPVDQAMYEHAFWSLMSDHEYEVLDTLDKALEEKSNERTN